MPKLSDWLVHPIVQEDITKNPKIKRALSSLVKKNLLPKTFATDVKKLQSFLTQNIKQQTEVSEKERKML